MAPTHQATNYTNIYPNQSTHWSNDWSYQSSSNASSTDMSNYWSSYDSDYWPTFQPSYQPTTTTNTNPYFSSGLSMSLPSLGSQQTLPDFISLMRQQQAGFEQEVEEEENIDSRRVEGVVDTEQLREELTFLARRKERQDLLLVKKDERKKGMMVTEEERQRKVAEVEAMRSEEQEWLTSSSFQLPMFNANWQFTLGRQPWLSDNYLNSRYVNYPVGKTLEKLGCNFN